MKNVEDKRLELLLEEIESNLSEKNIDIMGNALDILKNDDKFELYVENLCEGLDDKTREDFEQWAGNTRQEFLEEAATSADLNAFAPLQLTLLRSILPRLVMRNVITHKVLNAPAEQFGYLKAFLVDSTGKETELSELRSSSEFQKIAIKKTLTTFPAVDYNLFSGITGVSPLTLDRKFHFTNIVLECPDNAGTNKIDVTTTEIFTQGTDGGNIAFTVSGKHTDGTVTTASVYGVVDRSTGKLNLVTTSAAVKSIDFVGQTSPEYNNTSVWTIKHKYIKDTIEVGEGDIINSPLPYSYIKDLGALFKLDAMAQAVKTIGQSHASVDDIRIMEELYSEIDGDLTRTLKWSAEKAQGISKIDHNLELVERVNKAVSVCDDKTQFSGATSYNIVANPQDAAILSSTRINTGSFTGSVSKGGSLNNFNQFDITSGNGDITVYSTRLAKKGDIMIIPISNVEEEIVYAKYEYSNIMFSNSELRSSEAPLVKNIASIQRNAYKKFRTDAITMIKVEDDDLN